MGGFRTEAEAMSAARTLPTPQRAGTGARAPRPARQTGPRCTRRPRAERGRKPGRTAVAPGGRGGRGRGRSGGRVWGGSVDAEATWRPRCHDAAGPNGRRLLCPARHSRPPGLRGSEEWTRRDRAHETRTERHTAQAASIFRDLEAENSVWEPLPGHSVGTRPPQFTPPQAPP